MIWGSCLGTCAIPSPEMHDNFFNAQHLRKKREGMPLQKDSWNLEKAFGVWFLSLMNSSWYFASQVKLIGVHVDWRIVIACRRRRRIAVADKVMSCDGVQRIHLDFENRSVWKHSRSFQVEAGNLHAEFIRNRTPGRNRWDMVLMFAWEHAWWEYLQCFNDLGAAFERKLCNPIFRNQCELWNTKF